MTVILKLDSLKQNQHALDKIIIIDDKANCRVILIIGNDKPKARASMALIDRLSPIMKKVYTGLTGIVTQEFSSLSVNLTFQQAIASDSHSKFLPTS